MKSNDRFVSSENLKKIHAYSLKILEEVGVCFESEEALAILEKNGCRIDGQLAFFPGELVERCIKLVPDHFVLHNKDQQVQIGQAEMARFPWGLAVYKNQDDEISLLSDADIIRMFKLADTSAVLTGHTNFNLYENENWTEDQKKFANMAVSLKYANKPTFVSGEFHTKEDFCECIDIIKKFNGMALDNQNEFVTILRMNPLSPLTYDRLGIQFLLAACEKHQPLMIAPCAMPSLTAPPSIAGMVAMNNAEILGGIVLTQLMSPGLPILYGNTSCSTDLQTVLLSIGTPETALIVHLTVALGRFYNFPTRTGGALSDAKDADYQAGAESTLLMNATLEAGPDFSFHVCGMMGSFNVISEEKFILDEENYHILSRMQRGVNFNDENFRFDMIKKVGPRGNYLLQPKLTAMHMSEFYHHKVFNKGGPSTWQSDDGVKHKAKQIADKRVAAWKPPVLTAEQEAVLAPYIPEIYKTNF